MYLWFGSTGIWGWDYVLLVLGWGRCGVDFGVLGYKGVRFISGKWKEGGGSLF